MRCSFASRILAGALVAVIAACPAKAADQFEFVLKDPGTPEMEIQATSLLAESFRARGNETQAIKTYERLIAAEPAASDLRLAGLAQLAYLLEQKKEMRRAAQIYEKIESMYPGLLEVTDFFEYPTVRTMAAFLAQRRAEGGG